MKTSPTIEDAIGHTPLVHLARLGDGLPGIVLAKLESFSPGHSVKDPGYGVIFIDPTDIGRERAFERVRRPWSATLTTEEGEYPPETTPSSRAVLPRRCRWPPTGVGRDLRFTC